MCGKCNTAGDQSASQVPWHLLEAKNPGNHAFSEERAAARPLENHAEQPTGTESRRIDRVPLIWNAPLPDLIITRL